MNSVHVIGTGLLGTSLGLALTRKGIHVTLEDLSPTASALARDLGAGTLDAPAAPDLVAVATPPDAAATAVVAALDRFPTSTVTDLASVKGAVIRDLHTRAIDLDRYVGSHPMAGRERSGAISARYDLFEGRAWVLTPVPESSPASVDLVSETARIVGSAVITLEPDEHDDAVAAVSHVPQIVASLVAARLETLPDSAVALAGQGLRDVTRIAASDPGLWTQILSGNAAAVEAVLLDLRTDLDAVLGALGDLRQSTDAPGARGALASTLAAGQSGLVRIPGKHGAARTDYTTLRVVIPDRPGQLGALFADVGDLGVNIEEFRLDHGLGQALGLAEVDVLPAAAAILTAGLEERGWVIHD